MSKEFKPPAQPTKQERARLAGEACLKLPPQVLMQVIVGHVTDYARGWHEELRGNLGPSGRRTANHALTIEGLVDDFEMLELSESEKQAIRDFLSDPNVRSFTNFPSSPDNVVTLPKKPRNPKK